MLQIRKRDGTIVPFDEEKLTKAIENVFLDSKQKNTKQGAKYAKIILDSLEKQFKGIIPSTQDIEDILLESFRKSKQQVLVDAFAAYKKKHKEAFGFKTIFGVRDDIGLSENAVKVLAKRYLLRNLEGSIVETTSRMFRRVAHAIASIDAKYSQGQLKKTEDSFYEIMASLEFLPNTPTLMNAGTELGQLSACFVIPINDSLISIFDGVKTMALTQQSGGGTGFSFTKLRPKGDVVKSTKGVASGPLSFMRIFDMTTEIIKQGGKRRGANMGIINADHPDIIEFVNSKLDENLLQNFNISVGASDAFMEAVLQDKEWSLVDPKSRKVVRKVRAKVLFDTICQNAWKTGDPGIIFLDEINRKQPTPSIGLIESTNPCGEVPLLPNESCNLGSINLAKFVKNGKLEWDRLKKTIRLSVQFLDDIIDANKYPAPEMDAMTKSNRKIGLGVMGFADCIAKQNIPYDSDKALQFADKVMKFIRDEGHKMSEELGKQRGNFPNFEKSIYSKSKNLRNATVTTIAPTGTISIIANAASGIEPFFAVSYVREAMGGTKLLETNEYFEEVAKKQGFYSKELMIKIAKSGSIQKIAGIPKDVKKVFVTALDISPEWHVKLQAAFQKYSDNGVSKTINLPENAKVEDVRKAYLLAYKLKCKGITVYRYGSKKSQVLTIGAEHVVAGEEFTSGCNPDICPR